MKTITKEIYYQLLGLFVVHENLEAQRFAVEKTIAKIVDVETDALSSKHSVVDMLYDLQIEVEEE